MHPAVKNGSFDVERIRADFPALSMQVYGKPLVYLDNAASAQKPKAVLDRLTQAYESEYANVHRGLHYLANAATEAYEGAREKVRAFLNAERTEEIIFTRNATEAINLVAQTFGRERIKAGDEIAVAGFLVGHVDGSMTLNARARLLDHLLALSESLVVKHIGVAAFFAEVRGERIPRPHGDQPRIVGKFVLGDHAARINVSRQVPQRFRAPVARPHLVDGTPVRIVM